MYNIMIAIAQLNAKVSLHEYIYTHVPTYKKWS